MSYGSENNFQCPYCGKSNLLSLDIGDGNQYEMVTDCEVCCRPIVVHVRINDDEIEIDARAENE